MGRHLDKAKQVDASHECVKHEVVPGLVAVVDCAVDCVNNHERVHQVAHVLHSLFVVYLGHALVVGLFVLQAEVGKAISLFEFARLHELPHGKQNAKGMWD